MARDFFSVDDSCGAGAGEVKGFTFENVTGDESGIIGIEAAGFLGTGICLNRDGVTQLRDWLSEVLDSTEA